MKEKFFNPLQLKHLMAHKGSCLRAIATDEGLRFCPDFAQNITHVLDPVPVKMDSSDIRGKDGRNITYMIEDGYQIAKLADALDFTKAEAAKDGDNLDFVVGKKHFPMKLFSASEPYFDLNLEGYTGTVEWDAAGSEAMQICNVASYEIGTARQFLQGVFIDPEGMFVATDGCRMIYHKSCKAVGLEEFIKDFPKGCRKYSDFSNTFIMPSWTIPYLDGYAKVFYAYHDVEAIDSDHYPLHTPWSYWKLETGGETYLFNPIDGQFPKWRKVAPEYLDSHYEHKKTTFDFEGMKRYKKTGKKYDTLLCRFHDGTCTQMYNGEIELDIGVEFPLPEGIDMYANAQYLIDGAKVFGKQAEIEISLPDPDEGHIMKAVDIAGKNDLLHYVVMPRRAD